MEAPKSKRSPKNPSSLQKTEAQIQQEAIVRRARIKGLEDWIGFISAKVAGVSLVTAGALETIAPNIIPVVLANGPAIAGAGVTLLMGKSAIVWVGKIFDSLRDKDSI